MPVWTPCDGPTPLDLLFPHLLLPHKQGLTFEAFARFRALNSLLAAAGRSVPEECPICTEEFTPNRACVSLCCGHSFHK